MRATFVCLFCVSCLVSLFVAAQQRARASLYNTCRDNNITTAPRGLAPAVGTGPSHHHRTRATTAVRPNDQTTPHTPQQHDCHPSTHKLHCLQDSGTAMHRTKRPQPAHRGVPGQQGPSTPQHTRRLWFAWLLPCPADVAAATPAAAAPTHITARLVQQGRERIPPPLPLLLLTTPPAAYSLSCRWAHTHGSTGSRHTQDTHQHPAHRHQATHTCCTVPRYAPNLPTPGVLHAL